MCLLEMGASFMRVETIHCVFVKAPILSYLQL